MVLLFYLVSFILACEGGLFFGCVIITSNAWFLSRVVVERSGGVFTTKSSSFHSLRILWFPQGRPGINHARFSKRRFKWENSRNPFFFYKKKLSKSIHKKVYIIWRHISISYIRHVSLILKKLPRRDIRYLLQQAKVCVNTVGTLSHFRVRTRLQRRQTGPRRNSETLQCSFEVAAFRCRLDG